MSTCLNLHHALMGIWTEKMMTRWLESPLIPLSTCRSPKYWILCLYHFDSKISYPLTFFLYHNGLNIISFTHTPNVLFIRYIGLVLIWCVQGAFQSIKKHNIQMSFEDLINCQYFSFVHNQLTFSTSKHKQGE